MNNQQLQAQLQAQAALAQTQALNAQTHAVSAATSASAAAAAAANAAASSATNTSNLNTLLSYMARLSGMVVYNGNKSQISFWLEDNCRDSYELLPLGVSKCFIHFKSTEDENLFRIAFYEEIDK